MREQDLTLPVRSRLSLSGSGFASQLHRVTGRRSSMPAHEGRDDWDPSSSHLSAYDQIQGVTRAGALLFSAPNRLP